MRPVTAILVLPLVLAACAKVETPQEAREAAQQAYAEFDEQAAEARAEGSDEEGDIIGAASPGQIDTSGSAELTPGAWTVAVEDGERRALFGEEGQAPRISIACEVGGGIDIRLLGMVPQGGSATVYISTPEGGSTFTASGAVGDTQGAYISVPTADPFIGRLISGNGPFSLRMGGDQRIIFPADDVLTSVVSACDRRDTSTPTATDDTAPAAQTSETPAAPAEQ